LLLRGSDVVITGPREQTRRFGSGTGPVVRLFFDGARFSAIEEPECP
jgi:hypothetical protein